MKKKKTFTKTMTIAEVLKLDPNCTELLTSYGMHCFGCPFSQMETLEEAAEVHGFDVEELLNKLNKKA